MNAITITPTHTISAWSENGRPRRMWATSQPAEGGDDDGDAAHRRRALLGHVVLGSAVLLAEDRLAETAGAEHVDQHARHDQRQRPGDDAGDHHRDHGETPSRPVIMARLRLAGDHGEASSSAAADDLAVVERHAPRRRSSASSRGPCRPRRRRRPARPGRRPRRSPRPDPARRSRPSGPRIPLSTALMMASGSSERGLSDVTTATSARRATTSPMRGRFGWSRSPPAPNTTMTRPSVTARADVTTSASPSGVWA